MTGCLLLTDIHFAFMREWNLVTQGAKSTHLHILYISSLFHMHRKQSNDIMMTLLPNLFQGKGMCMPSR
jgi:hypothetical protein